MSKVILLSIPTPDYRGVTLGPKVRIEVDGEGIEGLVEAFASLLKASGYTEQTVNEYLYPELVQEQEDDLNAKVEAEVASRLAEAAEEKPSKRKLPKSIPSCLMTDEEEHA